MPDSTTGPVPIGELVTHMKDLARSLGRGVETTPEMVAERWGAVDELRSCFPGADVETLVRIAAYVSDLGAAMERAHLDGYAIAWGYAQFATVLAEDL